MPPIFQDLTHHVGTAILDVCYVGHDFGVKHIPWVKKHEYMHRQTNTFICLSVPDISLCQGLPQ